MNWQALLSRSVWNNTVSEWAFAVLVMILVTACISAIRRLGFYYFANLAKRTETQIDDAVVQVIGKTKWFFYLAVSVFAASRALDFPERFATGVDRAVFLAVLLQIGVWATWTVRVVVSSWAEARVGESERSAKTFAAAVRFVSSLVIWSVVAVFMLSNLGVEVSALLAGLGVGGVAVALAAQNVLGDLFASISIYLDRPFDIGDFVVVDALRGTVERVGLRSSRIRSITGEQVVVANR
ncbi:MAG: mechanosensitive ion channel, partial [Myxococcales bacterium]|nr:mechanosensitive ion channel [Myxococcales bacterium]